MPIRGRQHVQARTLRRPLSADHVNWQSRAASVKNSLIRTLGSTVRRSSQVAGHSSASAPLSIIIVCHPRYRGKLFVQREFLRDIRVARPPITDCTRVPSRASLHAPPSFSGSKNSDQMADRSNQPSITGSMKSGKRFSIEDILARDSGAEASFSSIKERHQSKDHMTPSAPTTTAGKVLPLVAMINEELIVMQCVHGVRRVRIMIISEIVCPLASRL